MRTRKLNIGERVYDESNNLWGKIVTINNIEKDKIDTDGDLDVLLYANCRYWYAKSNAIYQIVSDYVDCRFGYDICYEHNETEDDYPYYCPKLQENLFSFECAKKE